LELQDQIRALEQKLTDQDEDDRDNEDIEFLERRQAEGSVRAELLEKIRCKLLQYGKLFSP
jgi:hypothetical protein